jgi:predicted ABC-type transport system involved in lysophospholipase L1 biosynthesis ATPase subunit
MSEAAPQTAPPVSAPAPDAVPGPALVEALGLRKSYTLGRRTLDVLRGVNLAVRRGEFVALRGASGAGKSTLLHLLAGLDAPDAGRIHFDGRDLTRLNEGQLARWRSACVGFIFQAYHLLPELDALENVCLPGRIGGRAADAVEARGRQLLQRVGLADRAEHKPGELSGGEQQRVAIARALINEPALLFADEPTGNLDSRTGAEIIDLLCALRAERQTTLVIATHDASVAARAPRVLELVDGRVAGK